MKAKNTLFIAVASLLLILEAFPIKAEALSPANLSSNDNSLPRRDAVDIASYQSWMTQADFNSLKASGVKSIVVKISEGNYYINPYAKSQIDMAKSAGLNIAVYHYARFDYSNNPTQEGNYFASATKALGLPVSTVMIEDAEQDGYNGNWTIASQQFAQALRNNGFKKPRYYTSQSWLASGIMDASILGASNIWVAQYLYGKPSASRLQNAAYGAWQYSSQMYFQGTANLQRHPLDVSIDYQNFFGRLQPVIPAQERAVYRLYNPDNHDHLYTSNKTEAQQLADSGWDYEGIAWKTAKSNGQPVYRLYSPSAAYHFYTASKVEKDALEGRGWRAEGFGFYVDGSSPVYRSYEPGTGQHLFTKDAYEHGKLLRRAWRDEGLAWRAD
ncbi:GH25 family lysozyme [Lactococcus termiticola]|uniref:Lyzozyme M1 n=1 Tax=Lactococcus termiticola TaxID=2169526 RepID=A0A2R5HFC4_9LACT|nr:GH25 family lysozyme [Lactococcus termiticola]GBG96536.1 lyzozyme M1 [Lactococcus termiticola]